MYVCQFNQCCGLLPLAVATPLCDCQVGRGDANTFSQRGEITLLANKLPNTFRIRRFCRPLVARIIPLNLTLPGAKKHHVMC